MYCILPSTRCVKCISSDEKLQYLKKKAVFNQNVVEEIQFHHCSSKFNHDSTMYLSFSR